jgi:hypothetical protein
VDLSGGLKEQELDRGVEVLTRDQTGLGPDQSHIRGRPVGLQAGNPFGHHQLVQEGAQGHSGIRAANGEQVELLGSQQSLDERGFPRGHHGRRVDPAPEKLLGCVLWRESEQLDRASITRRVPLPLGSFETRQPLKPPGRWLGCGPR